MSVAQSGLGGFGSFLPRGLRPSLQEAGPQGLPLRLLERFRWPFGASA